MTPPLQWARFKFTYIYEQSSWFGFARQHNTSFMIASNLSWNASVCMLEGDPESFSNISPLSFAESHEIPSAA